MNTGWFGNTMWVSGGGSYDMNALHQQYAAGIYARQQEEERRQREEARQAQVAQQSSTRCTDSEQCASGFACIGGSCQQIDPTGATGEGGTSGCGAAPGGSGGSGGGGTGGSGCGGPAASSGGGGSSSSIQACSTSSGGSCSGGRGIGAGTGSGGGGGAPCGTRCCTCGTNGCGCFEGPCPPSPPNCSRFCTEASGLGSNVMSCGPKQCGLCEYCDRSTASCKRRSYDSDCRCDYTCPGCMKCGVGGGCLIKNCPPGKSKPPGEPSSDGGCEPNCRTSHSCIQLTPDSPMVCEASEECDDLPPDCEPCDCNCNDECGECKICNSAGKCVPDPACDCGAGDGKEYIRWELRYRHATGQVSSGSWAYGPVFACRTSNYDDNDPLIRTYCTPADESPVLTSTGGVDYGHVPSGDSGWCCLSNGYTQYTLRNRNGGVMWSGKVNGLQTSEGGGIQNNCKFGGYVTFSAISSNCGSCS